MAIMLPMVVTAAFAGSGPKRRPRGRRCAVKPLQHDARLHADRIRIAADDAPQVLGEINHQPGAERLAGHAAAGAAGVERDVIVGGILHAGRDVGRGPRTHHAQRPDFVDAAVAGEELAKQVVAAHVAGNQPAEVFLNSLALVIEFWHEMSSVQG